MSRLLSLLIGLALLVSMGLDLAAHANEQLCIPGVEATAEAGHIDGDADQVPADSEKGYSHHHGGCHDHHVALPFEAEEQLLLVSRAALLSPATDISAVAGLLDTALRPPIA